MSCDHIDTAINNHTASLLNKKKPGRKRTEDGWRTHYEKILRKEAKEADKELNLSLKTKDPTRESNINNNVIKVWKQSLCDYYELFVKLDFIERHKLDEIFLSDIETIQWYTIGSIWAKDYAAIKPGIEILFKKSYRHVSNLISLGEDIKCSVCKSCFNYEFDEVTNVNRLCCSNDACGHCVQY